MGYGPSRFHCQVQLSVTTEYLTKWPEGYCIPNKEAITVSRCLKKLVGRFGVPEIIISDQERNDNFFAVYIQLHAFVLLVM